MTDIYSLDTPYISIYDKPKKQSGRPRIYTEEEAQFLKRRETADKYVSDNYEYVCLRKRIKSQLKTGKTKYRAINL
jgi:hypothetical protein